MYVGYRRLAKKGQKTMSEFARYVRRPMSEFWATILNPYRPCGDRRNECLPLAIEPHKAKLIFSKGPPRDVLSWLGGRRQVAAPY